MVIGENRRSVFKLPRTVLLFEIESLSMRRDLERSMYIATLGYKLSKDAVTIGDGDRVRPIDRNQPGSISDCTPLAI